MDMSALLNALPDSNEENICLLFEGGAQPEETFLTFKSANEKKLHSLYLHPQLTEFKNYGPWLLEVENKEKLVNYLSALPGCTAIIISSRYPPSLAIQLSRGCTIVPPEGSAALVRFYANHVIEVLSTCAEHSWHAYLFSGITQWWLPGETQWLPLSIMPSEAEDPTDHIIHLDKITWQQIADKPDVTSVLNEWQKMAISRQFPPCVQREMVMKALSRARATGMVERADSKLYALYYLSGGRKILESAEIQPFLQKVNQGQMKLEQILTDPVLSDGERDEQVLWEYSGNLKK